ncbi:MAG: hypothetical protein ACR2OZ_04315 [Verrucomicrobiales bacterium]
MFLLTALPFANAAEYLQHAKRPLVTPPAEAKSEAVVCQSQYSGNLARFLLIIRQGVLTS